MLYIASLCIVLGSRGTRNSPLDASSLQYVEELVTHSVPEDRPAGGVGGPKTKYVLYATAFSTCPHGTGFRNIAAGIFCQKRETLCSLDHPKAEHAKERQVQEAIQLKIVSNRLGQILGVVGSVYPTWVSLKLSAWSRR